MGEGIGGIGGIIIGIIIVLFIVWLVISNIRICLLYTSDAADEL